MLHRGLPLVLAAALAVELGATPPEVLLPALLPALLQASLLVLFDRGQPQRLTLLAGGFLWGAVVASALSTLLNDAVYAWLAALLGHEPARSVTPVFGAPLIEETAKGAALAGLVLVRRPALATVRDGIVYGGLVGVGFAMTENVHYLLRVTVLGGSLPLAVTVYQRILGSLCHPLFTASFGAGLGWVRSSTGSGARVVAPALGFAAAVLQHALWNGATSPLAQAALCASPAPGAPCVIPPPPAALYLSFPLVLLLSLAPGVAVLAWLIRREAR